MGVFVEVELSVIPSLHAVVQTIYHTGLAIDQCGCDVYVMLRLSN